MTDVQPPALESDRPGRLVPVGDVAGLATALHDYLADAGLTREHGARRRAAEISTMPEFTGSPPGDDDGPETGQETKG